MIRWTYYIIAYVIHDRFRSWTQPVLINGVKFLAQGMPFFGFELTTERLSVRCSSRCTRQPLAIPFSDPFISDIRLYGNYVSPAKRGIHAVKLDRFSILLLELHAFSPIPFSKFIVCLFPYRLKQWQNKVVSAGTAL